MILKIVIIKVKVRRLSTHTGYFYFPSKKNPNGYEVLSLNYLNMLNMEQVIFTDSLKPMDKRYEYEEAPEIQIALPVNVIAEEFRNDAVYLNINTNLNSATVELEIKNDTN